MYNCIISGNILLTLCSILMASICIIKVFIVNRNKAHLKHVVKSCVIAMASKPLYQNVMCCLVLLICVYSQAYICGEHHQENISPSQYTNTYNANTAHETT